MGSKTMFFHHIFMLLAISFASATKYNNEIKILDGHTVKNYIKSPLPHTYVDYLPDEFTWQDVDGSSFLTHSLNQHLPQYCGSCWAHGAVSALADRIKIARQGKGDDIDLSIQYILNCGSDVAGSCYGGYHTGVYELIQQSGFIPFDTCNPYIACSSDSTEGFCGHVDTTCKKSNICRTCDTFGGMGGIFNDGTTSRSTNHIVSIVGWGIDEDSSIKHWIVRNSWGQYWGEMGFFRVEMGKNILGLESEVAWATPGSWTEVNFPCAENGVNCNNKKGGQRAQFYEDPSLNILKEQRRLRG